MRNASCDDIDRRESFRLDMEKELVDIAWTDSGGQQYRKKIICLDFSRGGLKLDSDQAIPLNTDTRINFKASRAGGQSIAGKVIRCQKQTNGWYEIALRLDAND